MGGFHIFYWITSTLIKFYKWIELNLLHIFSSRVEKRVKDAYHKIGVEFHGEGLKDPKISKKSEDNKGSDDDSKEKGNKWDIEVHNRGLFTRLANHASLAMGETYIDGYWDCEDIDELFFKIFSNNIFMEYLTPFNRFLNYIELCFFNLQDQARSWEVGKKHYDLGNDLFESFLDPWMTYSCGYWANAKNLNEAQVNKMELIAKKLNLKPGMKVLDIGCGWGGLCKYLAEKYGVDCVGITISTEGVKYGREKCKGLPVEFRLEDYRDLDETFDRVVSVGMFEHVGKHNYRTFFEVVHKCLKDDGIFLLHSIGSNHPEIPSIEPFFHTYIFPNGYLPYHRDILKYTEGLYVLEDWHNFGHDYSKTLLAWKENFDRNWCKISHKYGDRFYRMWSYYLLSSAGGFRSRKFQLWQIILSKAGVAGGYRSIR